MDSSSVIDPDTTSPPSDPSSTSSSNGSHRSDADIRDRIAMRAYELYLARGGAEGGDFDDWLAAERELANSNRGASGEGGGE
jgi:Protein of unknown function (DUF2934)